MQTTLNQYRAHSRFPGWVALLVCLLSSPLFAQQERVEDARAREKAKRVPVTVALIERLPIRNAPAVVLRHAGPAPGDIILLEREIATGEQLSAAIWTLLGARALGGDTATSNSVLRVGQSRGPTAWRGNETRVSEHVVRRLRSAAPTYLAGVGSVPNTRVYLPPNMLKDKMVSGKRRP